MDVRILATGSSGNSVLIDNRVVVDLGLTIKNYKSYGFENIEAVIITHPHGDHMKLPLVRHLLKEGMTMYLPALVISAIVSENKVDVPSLINSGQIIVMESQQTFHIGDISVTPHPQKHYDIVNYALVMEKGDKRLLYATDLDTVEPSDIGVGLLDLGIFDVILLEGNYDEIYLREYIEYMVSLVPSASSPDLLTDDELEKWVRANYRHLPQEISRNAFRAIQNHRHLSKQQARAYASTHLRQGGQYYEIHRSSMFYQAPEDWYQED